MSSTLPGVVRTRPATGRGGGSWQTLPVNAYASTLGRAAEAGPSTESEGRLAPALVADLAEAGLFKLWVPARYGGGEVTLQAGLDAIAAAGRADGATGWVIMIANTTALLASRLEPEAAMRFFGAPGAVCGGFAPPVGVATVGEHSASVTGRWAWGSGSSHATTMGGGVRFVDREGAAATLPNGSRTGFAFFADGVETLDTWHVAGMEGTASTDYRVEQVEVPLEHIVPLENRALVVDGPLYRFSVFGALALGVSMVMIGLGERAVDELADLAEKRPQGSTRGLGARATAQVDIARAEARLRSARAFVAEVTGRAWDQVERDGRFDDRSRVDLRLAANHAAEAAVQAVDACFATAGGAAVYKTSALQRVFRDVHVAAQHAMVSTRIYEPIGRHRFGLETDLRPL